MGNALDGSADEFAENEFDSETERQIFEKVRRSMIELGIVNPEISGPSATLDSECPTSNV
jgi:hypothetical protein